jgi:Family of unknown function (DUF5989)
VGYAARRMDRLRYVGKLFGHLVGFASENKVYWIVPLLVVLGLLAVVIFTGQASTPFIYSLF